MKEEIYREIKEQPNWETIACMYDTRRKRWTCLSAADVSLPGLEKHEIMQARGTKLSNEYETVGFKPEEGEITWVGVGKGSREYILEVLCDELKSLLRTGKTEWDLRVKPKLKEVL